MTTPARQPCQAGHITKRRDYLRIQSAGRGIRGRYLLLLQAKSADGDPGLVRAGFTVSRRVGGAVVRNRVKRRLRALWRAHGPVFQPCDLVFVAFRSAAAASFADLERDLLWLSRQGRSSRPRAAGC